jgi:hypothetical protein
MLQEFQFEDITFGIFPKVGAQVSSVYGSWARNSVGDIVEILMQMLEVRLIELPFVYLQIVNVF